MKDHRLWVSSSKDEPPYPLIGETSLSIDSYCEQNGPNVSVMLRLTPV